VKRKPSIDEIDQRPQRGGLPDEELDFILSDNIEYRRAMICLRRTKPKCESRPTAEIAFKHTSVKATQAV
jgi:hypothetical protein